MKRLRFGRIWVARRPGARPARPGNREAIGEACNRKMRTFVELAEKLKMPVEDLMKQANGQASPSKALVKGLAKELDINES
jgi:ribosome-binding protein aMBF1 (putative translation factor)